MHNSSSSRSTPPSTGGPEPWAEPVDGATLLREIRAVILRHVVMTPEEATATALFVVHAHAHDSFQISPILAVLSPEKRCGKSTFLAVLKQLMPRAIATANLSAAFIFRAIERYYPSLLIDEADTFLNGDPERIGILNSGHTRATASVSRTGGENYDPQLFSTWAPKVIAKIGTLPETLEDRSVVILLRRRLPSEQIAKVRPSDEDALRVLSAKAARWAIDVAGALADADPSVPVELHDRAADNWHPLLAIADQAGGDWPAEARRVARTFAGQKQQERSRSIKLLEDVQEVLADSLRDGFAPSEKLIAALRKLPESPWREVSGGRGLTAHLLARLLAPFGIRARQINNSSTAGSGGRGNNP
jgi:putative DNA primase/helicase